MPPRCAACPANMYADHSLRLAQEIVTKNFFLRLLRQKGKGGGKLRMIQNGGLAAGGKKIFFKLLRLGKLGDDFDRAAVFAVLEQNAARAAEAPARSPDPPRTIKDRLQVARAEIAAPKQDGVQRLVDIEQKMAEGKGRGYERWANAHVR